MTSKILHPRSHPAADPSVWWVIPAVLLAACPSSFTIGGMGDGGTQSTSSTGASSSTSGTSSSTGGTSGAACNPLSLDGTTCPSGSYCSFTTQPCADGLDNLASAGECEAQFACSADPLGPPCEGTPCTTNAQCNTLATCLQGVCQAVAGCTQISGCGAGCELAVVPHACDACLCPSCPGSPSSSASSSTSSTGSGGTSGGAPTTTGTSSSSSGGGGCTASLGDACGALGEGDVTCCEGTCQDPTGPGICCLTEGTACDSSAGNGGCCEPYQCDAGYCGGPPAGGDTFGCGGLECSADQLCAVQCFGPTWECEPMPSCPSGSICDCLLDAGTAWLGDTHSEVISCVVDGGVFASLPGGC